MRTTEKHINYLEHDGSAMLAYIKERACATPASSKTLLYCGGFASDMSGTKAQFFAEWGIENGFDVVRFDYRGHGKSGGNFTDFGLGDWVLDACRILDEVIEGDVVLVGSSMGGWIAARLALLRPERIQALVTIAAAPDFTEHDFWKALDTASRQKLENGEIIEIPSGYETPYRISPVLIENSRAELLFVAPLQINCPVRLFQGEADQSVSSLTAMRFFEHIQSSDIILSLVKHADHGFSRPQDLALVCRAILALGPS